MSTCRGHAGVMQGGILGVQVIPLKAGQGDRVWQNQGTNRWQVPAWWTAELAPCWAAGGGRGVQGTGCEGHRVWGQSGLILLQTMWCVRRSASTPCWLSTASVRPRPHSSRCLCTRPVASEFCKSCRGLRVLGEPQQSRELGGLATKLIPPCSQGSHATS